MDPTKSKDQDLPRYQSKCYLNPNLDSYGSVEDIGITKP